MAYWTPGHRLQNGKYIVEEILGCGGFGVTYRAKEQTTNKLVAIKTLNERIKATPDFVKHQERFVQEAFRLSQCRHEHIIQVKDIFQESGIWCTEGFAPIEQYELRAKRGTFTDVYGLAATLYYLLTGQMPFPAQFRQQGVNLIAPQQHNPQVSTCVNKAILQGMKMEPKDRPQNVQQWLEMLIPKKTKSPSIQKVSLPPKKTKPQLVQHVSLPQVSLPPKKNKSPSARKVSPITIDYMTLRNLLAVKQWKKADYDEDYSWRRGMGGGFFLQNEDNGEWWSGLAVLQCLFSRI